MKVSIEFDLSNPTQNRLLRQLLDALTVDDVAKVVAPVEPVVDIRTAEDIPSATPFTDLQAQLTSLFNSVYAAKPDDAMRVAGQCREEFGADNKNWTEDQWKISLSRIEALARF